MPHHLKHKKRTERRLLSRTWFSPSYLLEKIFCWGKHRTGKEVKKRTVVLCQPPTTVPRKSNCNCCCIQQHFKRFIVHFSGSSTSNYSINQTCFSSAHPEADQGICQGGLSREGINLHKCN